MYECLFVSDPSFSDLYLLNPILRDKSRAVAIDNAGTDEAL